MNTSGKILATFIIKQSGELSGTSWTVTNINNGKQAVTSLKNLRVCLAPMVKSAAQMDVMITLPLNGLSNQLIQQNKIAQQ